MVAGIDADVARWRRVGEDVAVDVAAMRSALPALRAELRGLDLCTSLEALSALAVGNQAVARLVQADLDAVALLDEAGVELDALPLAVFPSEPGALRAHEDDAGWRVDGVAQRSVHPAALHSALVSAATPEGDRLFAVELVPPAVVVDATPLAVLQPGDPNTQVGFQGARAVPVGTAQWWAGRPQQVQSVLRDAACLHGACVWLSGAIASTLAVRSRGNDMFRLGRADVWTWSARLALTEAADAVSAGTATGTAGEVMARRAAAVVATTSDIVIRQVAHLSDPRTSPSDRLPSRVAQLQLALRRYDAEANLRRLGELVADL